MTVRNDDGGCHNNDTLGGAYVDVCCSGDALEEYREPWSIATSSNTLPLWTSLTYFAMVGCRHTFMVKGGYEPAGGRAALTHGVLQNLFITHLSLSRIPLSTLGILL